MSGTIQTGSHKINGVPKDYNFPDPLGEVLTHTDMDVDGVQTDYNQGPAEGTIDEEIHKINGVPTVYWVPNVTGFGSSGGGGPVVPQFVSTWDTELTDATASPSQTIVLPMTAGPLVDWGDGTINNLNSHVYAAPGQKTIIIDNTNSDFSFDNTGDKTKIIDVSQCNGLNVTSTSMFERCDNLEWSATDAPNIAITSLGAMFLGCESLNGGGSFATWDVSNVTSMSNMFFGCFVFTGMGIENWDVGNCTNFNQMFFAAHVMGAGIGAWDMSSATNIGGMFRSANNFNVDVNAWDVSNCTTFNHVFNNTSMTYDLDNWDMGSAVTIHAMFGSTSYNGDITTWTFTSAIKDISWIFAGNSAFNRDIGGWNVASATNMSNMFGGASSFNQDISSWDFGSATNISTMLDNCGMDTVNYDAFLINLDNQSASLNIGLSLGAQGRTYTAAPSEGGEARARLVNAPALMTITGDTPVVAAFSSYDFSNASDLIPGAGPNDVEGWIDGVSSNDLSQLTAANQPLFNSDRIEFDGDDYLIGLQTQANDFSYFIKMSTTESSMVGVMLGSSSNGEQILFLQADGTVTYRSSLNINRVTSGDVNDGSEHVISVTKKNDQVNIYVNGSNVLGITDSGDFLVDWLGSRQFGGVEYSGDMFDVRVYDYAVTETEVIAVTNKLT